MNLRSTPLFPGLTRFNQHNSVCPAPVNENRLGRLPLRVAIDSILFSLGLPVATDQDPSDHGGMRKLHS